LLCILHIFWVFKVAAQIIWDTVDKANHRDEDQPCSIS
jgi:hypothetical protein